VRNRLITVALLVAFEGFLALAGRPGVSSRAPGLTLPGGEPIRLFAVTASAATANPMQQCIQNCRSCRSACLKTLAYCRKKGGHHAAPEHLRILQDCAEICRTSASFMGRGSEFHARTCGLCAEVCKQCGETCDHFPNDAQMKACAAACRRCAQSCQTMAGSST
jgi:hypothetical protein